MEREKERENIPALDFTPHSWNESLIKCKFDPVCSLPFTAQTLRQTAVGGVAISMEKKNVLQYSIIYTFTITHVSEKGAWSMCPLVPVKISATKWKRYRLCACQWRRHGLGMSVPIEEVWLLYQLYPLAFLTTNTSNCFIVKDLFWWLESCELKSPNCQNAWGVCGLSACQSWKNEGVGVSVGVVFVLVMLSERGMASVPVIHRRRKARVLSIPSSLKEVWLQCLSVLGKGRCGLCAWQTPWRRCGLCSCPVQWRL